MKAVLFAIAALLVGICMGLYLRGFVPETVSDSGVFVSVTDSSDYTLDAFVRTNSDMASLLDSTIGEFPSVEHVVAVVPVGNASYRIVLPECGRTRRLTDAQREKLFDVIGERLRHYSFSKKPL